MGVRENIKETISLYRDMNVARPRLVYDTKVDFINWNTTGINKGADKDIIKFIADICWMNNSTKDKSLHNHYFKHPEYLAQLLETRVAELTGITVWERNTGNLFYMDNKGFIYCIDGIYDKIDIDTWTPCGIDSKEYASIIQLEFMSQPLKGYRDLKVDVYLDNHNRYRYGTNFKVWCQYYFPNRNIIDCMFSIYSHIRLKPEQYKDRIPDIVINYWHRYRHKCMEYLEGDNK